MNSSILNIKNEAELYEKAFHVVLDTIRETLITHEECRIGLAGGSTPKKLYQMLANEHLPWEKIIWIGIDERYVPMNDKANNAGMIRSELIEKARASENNFLHFDTSLPYDQSALAFEQKLYQLKHIREPLFDLLILGAGHDGHIAGIFPDSEGAMRKGFLTAQTHTDIFDIHDRLTCTMEALTSCTKAILLLKGHEKHDLVKLLEQGDTTTPAGKFIEQVPTEVLYV